MMKHTIFIETAFLLFRMLTNNVVFRERRKISSTHAFANLLEVSLSAASRKQGRVQKWYRYVVDSWLHPKAPLLT